MFSNQMKKKQIKINAVHVEQKGIIYSRKYFCFDQIYKMQINPHTKKCVCCSGFLFFTTVFRIGAKCTFVILLSLFQLHTSIIKQHSALCFLSKKKKKKTRVKFWSYSSHCKSLTYFFGFNEITF